MVEPFIVPLFFHSFLFILVYFITVCFHMLLSLPGMSCSFSLFHQSTAQALSLGSLLGPLCSSCAPPRPTQVPTSVILYGNEPFACLTPLIDPLRCSLLSMVRVCCRNAALEVCSWGRILDVCGGETSCNIALASHTRQLAFSQGFTVKA